MAKGMIIGGRYDELMARQKSEEPLEIGELLVAEKHLLQVYDLVMGSQISQHNRELISGLALESNEPVKIIDEELRQYNIALLKELAILGERAKPAKTTPPFFSKLREVNENDFGFMKKPKNPLELGWLRSGSKKLNVKVILDGREALSHHILVPATTGRGKSNLLKCVLWSAAKELYCGMLVLDPHDEYYRPANSLSKHPNKKLIHYYSPNPLPGTNTLAINIKELRPKHFNGVTEWSAPQNDAITAYYRKYREKWIEAIILEKPLDFGFNESTLNVIRRKIMSLLEIDLEDNKILDNGIFKIGGGETTINDIITKLERGHTVIVDTSTRSGAVEILIGSVIAHNILSKYKWYKEQGMEKAVVSIVLEEAPRVIGHEVLKRGPNVFSTIAREGRKFGVGLFAITQLPSLIPRQILANMNTKIIMGLEMKPERQAIIESAAQDLSKDDRTIASLDKGEAIITTNFSPFALPVKIPLFEEVTENKKERFKKAYPGIR